MLASILWHTKSYLKEKSFCKTECIELSASYLYNKLTSWWFMQLCNSDNLAMLGKKFKASL